MSLMIGAKRICPLDMEGVSGGGSAAVLALALADKRAYFHTDEEQSERTHYETQNWNGGG